jgi:type II secretion system protein N
MGFLRTRTGKVLAAIALFLFFLVWCFPYQNLRGYVFGRIYAATRIYVTSDDMTLSLLGWPGIRLTKVTAIVPLQTGDMEISAERAVVRVGIGRLFPPAPMVSASFEGLKNGGDAYIKVVPGRTRLGLKASLDDVALVQFPLPTLNAVMAGRLSGKIDVDVDLAQLSKTVGLVELTGHDVTIPSLDLKHVIGVELPPLKLGELALRLRAQNGCAEIQTAQFGGKEADLSGSAVGDLRLADEVSQMFLTLTLRMELAEKYKSDPRSATLVSFLETFQGATPNKYGLGWKASFGEMQTDIFNKALPKKVE